MKILVRVEKSRCAEIVRAGLNVHLLLLVLLLLSLLLLAAAAAAAAAAASGVSDGIRGSLSQGCAPVQRELKVCC
jgi:hypothetical protein